MDASAYKRMEDENAQLVGRIKALDEFIADSKFPTLPRDQQYLLYDQKHAMRMYANALGKRLATNKPEEELTHGYKCQNCGHKRRPYTINPFSQARACDSAGHMYCCYAVFDDRPKVGKAPVEELTHGYKCMNCGHKRDKPAASPLSQARLCDARDARVGHLYCYYMRFDDRPKAYNPPETVDNRICKICDGGPGNGNACSCGIGAGGMGADKAPETDEDGNNVQSHSGLGRMFAKFGDELDAYLKNNPRWHEGADKD